MELKLVVCRSIGHWVRLGDMATSREEIGVEIVNTGTIPCPRDNHQTGTHKEFEDTTRHLEKGCCLIHHLLFGKHYYTPDTGHWILSHSRDSHWSGMHNKFKYKTGSQERTSPRLTLHDSFPSDWGYKMTVGRWCAMSLPICNLCLHLVWPWQVLAPSISSQ